MPDGHAIVLLQHRFAANYVLLPPLTEYRLGGRATFAHVSLGVNDPFLACSFIAAAHRAAEGHLVLHGDN